MESICQVLRSINGNVSIPGEFLIYEMTYACKSFSGESEFLDQNVHYSPQGHVHTN